MEPTGYDFFFPPSFELPYFLYETLSSKFVLFLLLDLSNFIQNQSFMFWKFSSFRQPKCLLIFGCTTQSAGS